MPDRRSSKDRSNDGTSIDAGGASDAPEQESFSSILLSIVHRLDGSEERTVGLGGLSMSDQSSTRWGASLTILLDLPRSSYVYACHHAISMSGPTKPPVYASEMQAGSKIRVCWTKRGHRRTERFVGRWFGRARNPESTSASSQRVWL